MLEKLVMLDGKGLVCPDTYSAEQHLSHSRLALDYSKSFVLDDYSKYLLSEKGISGNIRQRGLRKSALRKTEKLYKSDLSWVVGFKIELSYFIGGAGALPYGNPSTWLPFIVYSLGMKNVIAHECLHLIRRFTLFTSDRNRDFEEGFAEYGSLFPWCDFCSVEEMWKHRKAIKNASKKLEDSLGKNSLYALSRLTMNEVYAVKESSFPLDTLKSFGMIRHQVMKARLGI